MRETFRMAWRENRIFFQFAFLAYIKKIALLRGFMQQTWPKLKLPKSFHILKWFLIAFIFHQKNDALCPVNCRFNSENMDSFLN